MKRKDEDLVAETDNDELLHFIDLPKQHAHLVIIIPCEDDVIY